jgi:Flp pilus assembly protein CpaB
VRVGRAARLLRRRVLARRRLLAALCVGGAVTAGLHAVSAPPPPTAVVMTAAHDLPAGTVLEESDLRAAHWPPEGVPEGLVDDAVGRVLAAPLREGESVTDVRLVGGGLAAAHPELTTMPVRLPDSGLVGLLSPGDRIDLLATDPRGGTSEVVAQDALVLATPPPGDGGSATAEPPGALVVLGVEPTAAPGVAEASVRWFLSYVFAQ